MSISIIIPTYKAVDALELCLRSAIQGQKNINEIIVVIDGFYELHKETLEKYKEHIKILNLEENLGLCKATNYGVYNATKDYILIANDDNVFGKNWDIKLLDSYEENSIISPNQIEPTFSMFKQFNITDLGRDPKTFDLDNFINFSTQINRNIIEETGGTLPIFCKKEDYLKVGGWDENYPMGLTADWEFFLKCQLSGMKMLRTYKTHFYHFESLSTRKDPQKSKERYILQHQATDYCIYKWGGWISNNPLNNHKKLEKICI